MDRVIPQPLPRRCLRRMQSAARVAEGQGRADSPRLHAKAPWKLTLCLQRSLAQRSRAGSARCLPGGLLPGRFGVGRHGACSHSHPRPAPRSSVPRPARSSTPTPSPNTSCGFCWKVVLPEVPSGSAHRLRVPARCCPTSSKGAESTAQPSPCCTGAPGAPSTAKHREQLERNHRNARIHPIAQAHPKLPAQLKPNLTAAYCCSSRLRERRQQNPQPHSASRGATTAVTQRWHRCASGGNRAGDTAALCARR